MSYAIEDALAFVVKNGPWLLKVDQQTGLQSVLNAFGCFHLCSWGQAISDCNPITKKHFLMIGVKVAIESYRYSITPERTHKLTKMVFFNPKPKRYQISILSGIN